MNKNNILRTAWVLICIVVLSLGGCRSHRHLQQGDIAIDSTAAHQDDHTGRSDSEPPRLDTVKDVHYATYSANFSCTIEGMNINGQVRILHDSIIWISCTKIFEIGRLMATPTRVQAYSRLLNKYFDGDYATLCRRWGFDVDYATLQALLTGNCIPHSTLTEEPQLNAGKVTLTCSQATANSSQRRQVVMVKNFNDRKLLSTQIHSPAFAQRLNCIYRELLSINGQKIPKFIDLTLHSKRFNTNTTVEFDKITIDPTQTYPFHIPARATSL